MTRKSYEAGHSLAPRVAAVAVMVVAMNVAWQEIQYQLQPEREAELIRRREATIRANLYLLRSCIDQHLADKGYYPGSLQTLVFEGYLIHIFKFGCFVGGKRWFVNYDQARRNLSGKFEPD